MGILDVAKNPLIKKLDATHAESNLKINGKAWKKRRRAFFDDELVEIERKNHVGEDVILWRIYYKDLIMSRGTDDNKVEFRNRRGIWAYVPADPTRAERARAHFEDFVGDETKEESWHKLFKFIGVDADIFPSSVKACKKLFKSLSIYINIYDFVNAFQSNQAPHRFKTFRQLQHYSITNKLIFPLHEAKEDSALRILLQPIRQRR